MKKIIYILFSLVSASTAQAQRHQQPEIGIVENIQSDSMLAAAGYHHLVESVAKLISPKSVSEEQLNKNVMQIRKMKTTLLALNIFMPGDLKLVGPQMNEQAILSYAEEVFKRCNRAGVDLIIWGSGGARRVPDGFDHATAKEQFISIARKVAELAKKYRLRLALENLNSTETNFITTVAEALEVVKKVNHPHFRLCADIYHMLKEGEAPAVLEQSSEYLIHVDIAEKENRAAPGTMGDDFTPYLKALKTINYHGKIVLECRWTNLANQALPARVHLQKQIDQAYN